MNFRLGSPHCMELHSSSAIVGGAAGYKSTRHQWVVSQLLPAWRLVREFPSPLSESVVMTNCTPVSRNIGSVPRGGVPAHFSSILYPTRPHYSPQLGAQLVYKTAHLLQIFERRDKLSWWGSTWNPNTLVNLPYKHCILSRALITVHDCQSRR